MASSVYLVSSSATMANASPRFGSVMDIQTAMTAAMNWAVNP